MVSPIIDGGVNTQQVANTLLGKEVVVTAPNSLAIEPYEVLDKSLVSRKPKIPIKPEERVLLDIDDEFQDEPKVMLKANTTVTFAQKDPDDKDKEIIIDITSNIDKELEDISRTRGLETGTYRCNILQRMADNMVPDNSKWKGNIRVVIMNKGKDIDAAALPDGTVILSQALLNELDTMDEIAEILGHEVGHLINETSLTQLKARFKPNSSWGIAWLHEMVSDFKGSSTTNNLGFNPNAGIIVFEKLERLLGNGRDIEHQSSAIRGIQQRVTQSVIDFEGSNKEYTPIMAEFIKEVIPTNLEYLTEIALEGNLGKNYDLVRRLRPSDLNQFFSMYRYNSNFKLLQDRNKSLTNGQKEGILNEKYPEDKKAVIKIITERLTEFGLNTNQIKIFFYTDRYADELSIFNGIEEIISLIPEIDRMTRDNTLKNSFLKIFNSHDTHQPLRAILSQVRETIYKKDSPNKDLIKDVNQVVRLLDLINRLIIKVPSLSFGNEEKEKLKISETEYFRSEYDYYLDDFISNLIFEYSYFVILKDANSIEDVNSLRDFYSVLKSANLSIVIPYSRYEKPYKRFPDSIIMEGNYKTKVNEIEKIYIEVFSKEFQLEYKSIPIPPINEFDDLTRNFSTNEFHEYFLKYWNASFSRQDIIGEELYYKYFRSTILTLSKAKPETGYVDNFVITVLKKTLSDEELKSFESYGTFDGSKPEIRPSIELLLTLKSLNRDDLLIQANKNFEIENLRGILKFLCLKFWANHYPKATLVMAEEFLRSQSEIIDFKSLATIDIYNIIKPIFAHTDHESDLILRDPRVEESTQNNASTEDEIFESEVGKGRDFERIYSNPVIQEIISRTRAVRFDSLAELLNDNTFKLFIVELQRSTDYEDGERNIFPLFSDSMDSLIFLDSYRSEILRLTQPGKIKAEDYPVLLELIEHHFPNSTDKIELVKTIEIDYLKNKSIDLRKRIDFFIERYKSLSIEGALIIGDQITSSDDFYYFKQKTGSEFSKYIVGDSGLSKTAAIDYSLSELSENANLLIKTTSTISTVEKELSTKLAESWLELAAGRQITTSAYYDKKSEKIFLTSRLKAVFLTFRDSIERIKGMSNSNRIMLAVRALSDTNGLLTSDDGKKLLIESLVTSLNIKNSFILRLIETAITSGSKSILTFPAAKMIAPYLFRAIKTEAVDIEGIRTKTDPERDNKSYFYNFRYQPAYLENLPFILGSKTDDIVAYGNKYKLRPDSTVAKAATEHALLYKELVQNLRSELLKEERDDNQDERPSKLSPEINAVISVLESNSLTARAGQMAVQIKEFSNEVRDRLSEIQDSIKGQSKLAFWNNLLKRTEPGPEYDPEFAKFFQENFVSLDEYRGGGSLFTTYSATIKDGDSGTKKVVIKMLNPNAESSTLDVYKFCSSVLLKIIETSDGEVRDDATLTLNLLELSNTWCSEDINDQTYVEDDDSFRLTINSFNRRVGAQIIGASERIFTSKKVKIETEVQGNTLNRKQKDKNIDDSQKRSWARHLLAFFNYQFINSPKNDDKGNDIYYFHSDPHTGNYMVDERTTSSELDVIDRSMYLKLSKDEVNTFKLLKDGNALGFVNSFIDKCLEVNKVGIVERVQIKVKILEKLGHEFRKQNKSQQQDYSKYLEIIQKEFLNYGDRYSTVTPFDQLLPEDKIEVTDEKEVFLLDYFTKNPSQKALDAYALLSKNDTFKSFYLNLEDFKTVLSEMNNKGLLKKDAIDIPLKYRLMIRNIVAMQNLRKRWL